MPSDGELVARSLAGDTAAFGVLVERYRMPLLRLCRGRVGDLGEAEDLAQEAFVRAYFDLHALREPEHFEAWLRAIAHRLCQSWHRRRREVPQDPFEMGEQAAAPAEAPLIETILTRQALAQLAAAQQRVLGLRHLEGYTVSEIARILDAPPETVRTRLRRARQRLREVWTAMTSEETSGEQFVERVLEKLDVVGMESGLVWPVAACLHALGSDWPLAYVDGILGTAFDAAVNERIGDSGPTDAMDWGRWFGRIPSLGYEATVVNAQLNSLSPDVPANTEDEFRAAQAATWDAVRASLDRGVPAIAWMPMTREQHAAGVRCEYGLLIGYDTRDRTYQVRLPWMAPYSVPWDGFGRADPVNWLNVIVFGAARPVDRDGLERSVLQNAVATARTGQPGRGLGAYDTWMDALRGGSIQGDGGLRAARILREARGNAATFLRDIQPRFPAGSTDLSEAAGRYGQVSQAWDDYLRVFLPAGPDAALDAARRDAGLQIVLAARAEEEGAVSALERALAKAGA